MTWPTCAHAKIHRQTLDGRTDGRTGKQTYHELIGIIRAGLVRSLSECNIRPHKLNVHCTVNCPGSKNKSLKLINSKKRMRVWWSLVEYIVTCICVLHMTYVYRLWTFVQNYVRVIGLVYAMKSSDIYKPTISTRKRVTPWILWIWIKTNECIYRVYIEYIKSISIQGALKGRQNVCVRKKLLLNENKLHQLHLRERSRIPPSSQYLNVRLKFQMSRCSAYAQREQGSSETYLQAG